MQCDLTRWGGGCVLALVLGVLPGCASTGSASPSARPVLYPNATLHRVGDAQGRAEADACMARAVAAGLTPAENTNAVARGAGVGAATGGVAAVGGSAGAVQGAFRNDRPSSTYRTYVQRCLGERGFDVIGWN